MRKLLIGAMAAFAAAASPLALHAQDTAKDEAVQGVPGSTNSITDKRGDFAMSEDQQAIYDSWDADQQTQYTAWEPTYREYYWTLPEERQRGYWMLTPDQRMQIYNMTPEQRELAWQSITAQLAGMTPATPATQANPPGEGMPTNTVPTPETAEEAVPPAMPADESYEGGPYKGALTPPPVTNKEYPVCTRTLKDGCRNPGGK